MFIANDRNPQQAMDKCRAQAQANADFSRVPWMIFQDTNSNYCVERLDVRVHSILEVRYPEQSAMDAKGKP